MKHFITISLAIALAGISISLSSCGNNNANTENAGPEYTSEYVCPMHCEGSGSATEGQCPVCGMDYVKNEEHGDHKH